MATYIANAGVNTAAFLQAIAAGGAYVPPSAGFVVNNGQIRVGGNVKVWGEASMGSNPSMGEHFAHYRPRPRRHFGRERGRLPDKGRTGI